MLKSRAPIAAGKLACSCTHNLLLLLLPLLLLLQACR
jgi:hypothetical protein